MPWFDTGSKYATDLRLPHELEEPERPMPGLVVTCLSGLVLIHIDGEQSLVYLAHEARELAAALLAAADEAERSEEG